MSTGNTVSVVDLLIFSAPKGESPYAYAANFIAHAMPDKVSHLKNQVNKRLRISLVLAGVVLQTSNFIGGFEHMVGLIYQYQPIFNAV